MRMGADNLESVYQDYGVDKEPVTIIDVYNMTMQERFNLYMGQVEFGFSLFNDMLDHFCLYGADYKEEDYDEYLESLYNIENKKDDSDNGSGSPEQQVLYPDFDKTEDSFNYTDLFEYDFGVPIIKTNTVH